MISRPIAAIAAGLIALTAAPTLVVGLALPAVAQADTIQVQSAITSAINTAKAAADYPGLTPAQRDQRLAAAVQRAISSQLLNGASAADISAALANLVNARFLDLAIAAQGAAQAASQVASQVSAGTDTKAQALLLITHMSDGTSPLGIQIAAAGGLNVAVSATTAGGQTVTVYTSLSTVLAGAATGSLGNATFNANGTLTIGSTTGSTGYTPCTNNIADYC